MTGDDLDAPPQVARLASNLIPHRIFRNVLGSETVAALIDYACQRQADFKPARIYHRITRESSVDAESRACWRLTDLGVFSQPILDFVTTHAATAAKEMGLFETELDPRELEICAYEDGGFFRRHVDTLSKGPPRVLTCVYYFSTTPRQFEGGELRLHALPTLDGRTDVFDVPPENDTLVMFPSLLRHEVLPVIKPSPEWRTNRFNITTWACRPAAKIRPNS